MHETHTHKLLHTQAHTSKLIPVKVFALTVFCPSLPLSAAAARAATLAGMGERKTQGEHTYFNVGAPYLSR